MFLENQVGTGIVEFVVQAPEEAEYTVYEPNEWTWTWEGRTFVEMLWGPVVGNAVDLQMSLDNGGTWTRVVAGITLYGTFDHHGNPFGYYRFLCPNVDSTQALVRVSGPDVTTGTSTSVTVAASIQTRTGAWRYDHFGHTNNVGEAADEADPDDDKVRNIFEYIFESAPTDPTDTGRAEVKVIDGRPHLVFHWGFEALDLAVSVEMGEDPSGFTQTWSSMRYPLAQETTVAFPLDLRNGGLSRMQAHRPGSTGP